MELLPEKVSKNGYEMIKKLLQQFFSEELEALSPLTLRARTSDLKKFLEFYYSVYKTYDLNFWYVRDTRSYIEYLFGQKYAPNYINRNISSVCFFGKWLFINKFINQNPVKHIKEIKLDESKPKAIDDLTQSRLFKIADMLIANPKTIRSQDIRNAVLLRTLLACGLRIEETLNLKVFQFEGNRFLNVLTKSGKIRTAVAINKETADMIRDYVQNVRTSGSDYLFTNYEGNKLPTSELRKHYFYIKPLISTT